MTISPPFQGIRPLGNVKPSANSVRRSIRPSPSVSSRARDPPCRRLALTGTGRITPILGDIEPPALIKRDRHRALDHWFNGHQLDSQAGLETKGFLRLLGGERPVGRLRLRDACQKEYDAESAGHGADSEE